MRDDVVLKVNGREFAGWQGVKITRGIEALSGAFELTVTDRWAEEQQPWQIVEEDECELSIAGAVLLTGFVDRRSISFGPAEHSLKISGRDRAAALVDCSAVLDAWEYKGISLPKLASRLGAPFGVSVALAPGLVLPTPPQKFSLQPGESAFDALERACRAAGVLPVSDGRGGVVLTRSGTSRAVTALVEGENILSATADYDATRRFRSYRVAAQHPGSDTWFGASAAGVLGHAEDSTVKRSDRLLYVRAEAGMSRAAATKRAQWEAKVRAARGDSVTVTVPGWLQGDGTPWPVNALVSLRSPKLGMNGVDMLISQVVHQRSMAGTTSELSLKRPDAYTPEPVVKKPGAGGPNRTWKEISKGA